MKYVEEVRLVDKLDQPDSVTSCCGEQFVHWNHNHNFYLSSNNSLDKIFEYFSWNFLSLIIFVLIFPFVFFFSLYRFSISPKAEESEKTEELSNIGGSKILKVNKLDFTKQTIAKHSSLIKEG